MANRSLPSVVVLGAGGHAKVVISTLRAAGHLVTGVLDDNPATWGTIILGAPVRGAISTLRDLDAPHAVIAVGANAARERIAAALEGVTWVAVVHPRAVVDPSVAIGAGTVIFAGAVVQPDVEIGAHAIVNTSASIDHDCEIGDFVHVAPGAHVAGGVVVERAAFIGIGAAVIPERRIGEKAVVGAGAAVVRDVPPGHTVVGVPAGLVTKRLS